MKLLIAIVIALAGLELAVFAVLLLLPNHINLRMATVEISALAALSQTVVAFIAVWAIRDTRLFKSLVSFSFSCLVLITLVVEVKNNQ